MGADFGAVQLIGAESAPILTVDAGLHGRRPTAMSFTLASRPWWLMAVIRRAVKGRSMAPNK